MNRKTYNNVKIFIIALAICLIAVPFSRYLSPRAIVNGHDVYLAWLPLSVMLAVILLFGRRAILPILLGRVRISTLRNENETFSQLNSITYIGVFLRLVTYSHLP